jgi:hypothetical protein
LVEFERADGELKQLGFNLAEGKNLVHEAQRTLAIHQFDAPEGAENNWHGALDQIPRPAASSSQGRQARRT